MARKRRKMLRKKLGLANWRWKERKPDSLRRKRAESQIEENLLALENVHLLQSGFPDLIVSTSLATLRLCNLIIYGLNCVYECPVLLK